eukprot:12237547-Alexandrium_andersonii.AAC.1
MALAAGAWSTVWCSGNSLRCSGWCTETVAPAWPCEPWWRREPTGSKSPAVVRRAVLGRCAGPRGQGGRPTNPA